MRALPDATFATQAAAAGFRSRQAGDVAHARLREAAREAFAGEVP
jgi:hypothetical protein